MSQAATIDVAEVVDRQKLGPFHFQALAILMLIALTDGFDLQAGGFAAPALVRAWGVERAALTPMLTASLVGMLIGAPLLGWFGDRFGRRPVIVAGVAGYGLASLAAAQSGDLWTLAAWRFVTGIGLGGVLPNVLALAAELSPRRGRALITTFTAVAVTLGAALVGVVAAQLIPAYGWTSIFLVGGVVPLGIAVVAFLTLPESPAFLAAAPGRRERLVRLLRRVEPGFQAPADAVYVAREEDVGDTRLSALFRGELARVTPLLWMIYPCMLLTLFMVTSWLPVVLEAQGLSPARSAIINAMYQFGAFFGGLAAGVLLGRLKMLLLVGLVVLGWIGVALVSQLTLPELGLGLAVALNGVGVGGGIAALNASASLIYPPAVRAKGVGWALGLGRTGSIFGPILGGAVIGAGAVTAQRLFLIPLLTLAIAFVIALLLVKFARLRL